MAYAGDEDVPDEKKAPTSTALVREVSLVALRQWLRVPGSDVEKALRRAMRARHAELNQATRAAIAQRVLGIAVFYGRLGHLLDRAFRRNQGNIDPEIEAEMLLELYVGRELREEGGLTLSNLSNGLQGGQGGHGCLDDAVECKLREAVRAPLFEADEEPLLAVRLATAWSLPLWMAESWLQQFGPLSAFQLGRAMCQPARVTLRVNTFKTTRLKLMELLANHGVRSVPTAESPVGLWLPDGRPPAGGVWQLPGYSEGLFEVQDEGSQLLALATEAKPGDLVVDYCAGRGGKTWFLASLVSPNGSVCAWDIEEDLRKQLQGARAKRALGETNLHLLEVPPSKPHNLHADVVLVDAPCSSSGVLRRHPSQRWALRLQEVSEIADLQLSILEEASQLLRPGGRLVYATCSLIHLENQSVVAGFEALQRGFVRWPFPSGRHCRTLLPHVEGTDGFFMARWEKKSCEDLNFAPCQWMSMADLEDNLDEAEKAFESQYEKVEPSLLGEGTYGKVFKAKSIRTGELVAMKQMKIEGSEDGMPSTALREIALLKELKDHQNIVKLINIFYKPNKLVLVFEFVENDLKNYLESRGKSTTVPSEEDEERTEDTEAISELTQALT
ncbi:unnamed protein product [Cladocopium goreaui]|uniref:cyclin-dependent kinase n=1 Tax=Cladocopium goreaui TaxID=2562237 RepID=A0A9P1C9Z4_9DINO|nr:unnamed protein product [Cladocopium goreaui]